MSTYRTSENLILKTDSYKVSHWRQYPRGMTATHVFFESRGGEFPAAVFFGLQYILKRHLVGSVVCKDDIAEAKDYYGSHFGDPTLFNEAGWERVVGKYDGRLPVIIRAVPEGTIVPAHNVLMTIENTDPLLGWLPGHLETILSQDWYPSSVATVSHAMRRVMLRYLEETGDPSLIDYKVHDFGYRGSTSYESAGIGGAAHLVNFRGTDTIAALEVARKYYHERMAGNSIPAAEHSTITSWGKSNERRVYEHMLTEFPTGLVAVVSDSYDVFHACRELWGRELRDQVLARDGVLVVRPDSGHPPTVVVKVLEILGAAFGTTVNAKGYRVLHPKVRVIQGDGIDLAMLEAVLEAMKRAGWSADNVAFGSGGGLLQKVNRDTLKFALKCSAIRIGDTWHDVFKDPVTDPGKRSKAGRLALVRQNDLFSTMRVEEADRLGLKNELVVNFANGDHVTDWTFADIRERVARSAA